MFKRISTLLTIACFFSCSESKPKPHSEIKEETIVVVLQPFSDISKEEVSYVYTALQKVYPKVVLNNNIDLPHQAYYKEKNRYRADSLIQQLNRKANKEQVIIGLTAKDISTTKNSIKDWGVMGLGFCPGRACVASTFRLNNQNKQEQLFKVAIHELGHTQGLPHCEVTACFMRDAEGHNPTNEEKEFCLKCKKVLIEKGFTF